MELEIIVDIETDGLLPDVTKIHCIGMTVVGASAAQIFANEEPYECIENGLELMSSAKSITGHNLIGYDLPVLKKLLGWTPSKHTEIIDTLVLSRLCHTSLREVDAKQKAIETKLWGSHSLKAWGKRLSVEKSELAGDDVWSHFNEEMADYCMQDVLVTSALKYHFELQEYSPAAIELEHQFAKIIPVPYTQPTLPPIPHL